LRFGLIAWLLIACSTEPINQYYDLVDAPTSDAIVEVLGDTIGDQGADRGDEPDSASVDLEGDAPADVAPDSGPDTEPDNGPDGESDGSPDVAPDAASDVAPDAASDVAPDAAPDGPGPGTREGLLAEMVGFAESGGTTGGAGGAVCHVTNLADDGPGTLRFCAESDELVWIVFDESGVIDLASPIHVGANTTIDGRGQHIEVTGEGFEINAVSNVIIAYLTIRDGDDDAVQIIHGAERVWLHHLSLSNFFDGLVDITRASTDVTVSWCHFTDHDKTMLISANPDHTDDVIIRVTLHHNWFEETIQRHPRARWGRVHIFNNHFDGWGSYAVGASHLSSVLSENNIFEAGGDDDAILNIVGDDPEHGSVRSQGDWLLNDAVVNEHNTEAVFDPATHYDYTAQSADGALRERISAGAGWREVPAPD